MRMTVVTTQAGELVAAGIGDHTQPDPDDPGEPHYASRWEARDHYDFNAPPLRPGRVTQAGPTADPGSIEANIGGGEVDRPEPTLADLSPDDLFAKLDRGRLSSLSPTSLPELGHELQELAGAGKAMGTFWFLTKPECPPVSSLPSPRRKIRVLLDSGGERREQVRGVVDVLQ